VAVFIMDVEETKSKTVVTKADTLQQAIDKVRSGSDFAVLQESPVARAEVIRHELRKTE
jgi:hypothetical protein